MEDSAFFRRNQYIPLTVKILAETNSERRRQFQGSRQECNPFQKFIG
jgi:hypothetical protein